MSRRTFPRVFAAGLLVGALIAPAQAQPANPWRGTAATPKPAACCETACPACAAAAPAPCPINPVADNPVQVVGTLLGAATGSPSCRTDTQAQTSATKLTGTWYREVPGTVAAVTFRDGDLKATATTNVEGTLVSVTLTADYAVAKDGTVHGVITGADVTLGGVQKSEAAEALEEALAKLSAGMQSLVDQPFAVRVRPVDGGWMFNQVRLARATDSHIDFVADTKLLIGMFKHAGAGAVPAPKPAKFVTLNVYSPDPSIRMTQLLDTAAATTPKPPEPSSPAVSGMTLPNPKYLEHCPQYFPPEHQLPRELSGVRLPPEGAIPRELESVKLPPCPAPQVVVPCPMPARSGPPPEVYEVMVTTFGQMMNTQNAPVPTVVLPSPPRIPPLISCPPSAGVGLVPVGAVTITPVQPIPYSTESAADAVPPMPPPAPLPSKGEAEALKGVGRPAPIHGLNERLRQLLPVDDFESRPIGEPVPDQPNESRKTKKERRRKKNEPSHLTPERIHGGIL